MASQRTATTTVCTTSSSRHTSVRDETTTRSKSPRHCMRLRPRSPRSGEWRDVAGKTGRRGCRARREVHRAAPHRHEEVRLCVRIIDQPRSSWRAWGRASRPVCSMASSMKPGRGDGRRMLGGVVATPGEAREVDHPGTHSTAQRRRCGYGSMPSMNRSATKRSSPAETVPTSTARIQPTVRTASSTRTRPAASRQTRRSIGPAV